MTLTHIRLKKLTHPSNTNAVEFLYGSASSQDDVLSRVRQLKWNGTVVTEYSHLGLDLTVVVDYQQPDVKWNLVSGSGNYPYDGWDRYDRVINALWQYYGGSPANREQVLYGFNRANNRLWRQNTVAGTGQDEYYTYDGLFQVKTLDRGTLTGTPPSGISGTPSWEEDWNYDETGNWRGSSSAYITKAAGTTTLNQNRTHNVANEITDITETTGTAWPTPAHDGNGNLTQVPRPLSLGNGFDLKYDAWNRLVEVKNTGGATIATYRYDGFHRRVSSYDGTNTRHYYYSRWWQVIEERLNSGSTAERSFVWGLRYLDDLVLRQKSSERLYALHDYYSVTAIADTSGTVVERYGYDGFGTPRYMDGSFGARGSSSYGWETLYGAYRYDADTGLYQVRFRYYHSKLGRWLSRDPIGEDDGPNLYAYVRNRAVNFVDIDGRTGWGFAGPGWEFHNEDGRWEYWQPGPDPRGEACLKKCAGEVFGLETAIAAALIGAGQPIMSKDGAQLPNASRRTSPARRIADRVFGESKLPRDFFPRGLPTPTVANPRACSRYVAAVAGRWAPIVGWCLLANDLREFGNCVDKCMGR